MRSSVDASSNRINFALWSIFLVIIPTVFARWLDLPDDTDIQWLAADYFPRIVTLVIIASVPALRTCILSSFGPIARPDEIPSLTWVRVSAYTFGAIMLFVYVDVFVYFPLQDFMPDWRTAEYPRIEHVSLYWFDLTFGLMLVAVSEEFVFRGVIKRVVEGFVPNRLVVVALSSVIFGLVHWRYGVSSVVGAFFFGVVYMILFMSTRSLWSPVIAHYVTNFIYFSNYYAADSY